MSDKVRLSGTASLQTGVIDLNQVGDLAQAIVEARHTFEMQPHKHEEGWRVEITLDLQSGKTLTLIDELMAREVFIKAP